MERIPEHLKIRFAIEDKKGKIIKAGRDKKILLEKIKTSPLPEPDFKKIRGEWERENLSGWKDLDLPEKVMVKNRGQNVPLYPALKKTETRVDLRLMVNRDEAVRAHREGTAALFRTYYRKEEKSLRSYLALKDRMPVRFSIWEVRRNFSMPSGKGSFWICSADPNAARSRTSPN